MARIAYCSAKFLTPAVLLREPKLRIFGAADRLPLPPSRLIYTVIGHGWQSLFFDTGLAAVVSMRSLLGEAGVDIARIKCILDFGCGCGRLIRHWVGDGLEIHGTDYNPSLVRWCARNLAFARFRTNDLHPPLPYSSNTFDLVYARSVFTHLSAETQCEWLGEILRVLNTGGVFLFTTHGERFIDQLTHEERSRYRVGEVVTPHTTREGSNKFGTVQSPEATARLLLSGFRLLSYTPGGAQNDQDTYVVQKAEVNAMADSQAPTR